MTPLIIYHLFNLLGQQNVDAIRLSPNGVFQMCSVLKYTFYLQCGLCLHLENSKPTDSCCVANLGECRILQENLAKAAKGEAFVLQGGDFAEAFCQFSTNRIKDTYEVLLQMSLVMMFGGGVSVVKMGRMTGQFAKPHSSDTEVIDGVELPSSRGDIINSSKFTATARTPDPWRMVKAYNQCAATLCLA